MKYLSLILSLVITIIFLEVLSRIIIDDGMNYELEMKKYANKLKIISSNKEIGLEHRKNLSAKLMGVDVILDDNGFRVTTNIKKNNFENKILMLGDSMTLGWGAKKPFANILNEKINNYKIINAGIGNTNTKMQIVNFFENFNNKYQYKMIVLNFFINDFENVKIEKPNLLQKYSYLYTYLNNKINTVLIQFKLKKNWEKFYSDNFLDVEMRNKTLNYIKDLNDFCLKNNIKFIIHNIPELRDLDNYKFHNETNIIKKFSEQKNIYFIDSYEVLKKYDEKNLWVTELDPHANDKAHAIIADFLYKKIKELIYIN